MGIAHSRTNKAASSPSAPAPTLSSMPPPPPHTHSPGGTSPQNTAKMPETRSNNRQTGSSFDASAPGQSSTTATVFVLLHRGGRLLAFISDSLPPVEVGRRPPEGGGGHWRGGFREGRWGGGAVGRVGWGAGPCSTSFCTTDRSTSAWIAVGCPTTVEPGLMDAGTFPSFSSATSWGPPCTPPPLATGRALSKHQRPHRTIAFPTAVSGGQEGGPSAVATRGTGPCRITTLHLSAPPVCTTPQRFGAATPPSPAAALWGGSAAAGLCPRGPCC